MEIVQPNFLANGTEFLLIHLYRLASPSVSTSDILPQGLDAVTVIDLEHTSANCFAVFSRNASQPKKSTILVSLKVTMKWSGSWSSFAVLQ